VGDSRTGNGQHVTRSHGESWKGAEHTFADEEELPPLPVDEGEAPIESLGGDSVEPVPDGIDGFRLQVGSPGCDFSSVVFERGEELRASDLKATDPAGSLATLSGTAPLHAPAGCGDAGLVGHRGKAIQ